MERLAGGRTELDRQPLKKIGEKSYREGHVRHLLFKGNTLFNYNY